MCKILVFAGTSDGRRLGEQLGALGYTVIFSVTTLHGASLIQAGGNIKVLVGEKNSTEITKLLKEDKYKVVVDATHPFAQSASTEIKSACNNTGTPYYRLVRGSAKESYGHYVDTVSQVIKVLNQGSGLILLTTGSKNLKEFTQVKDYNQRIFPRVLPLISSLEACIALGYNPQQIIAIQGPFSKAFNKALIKEKGINWLVTKESGAPGGFLEKVEACKETGTNLIVIRRPQETGFSYNMVLEEIKDQWKIRKK